MQPPPAEVLDEFRAEIVRPLGGRQDRHWLVDSAGHMMSLRLWAPGAESGLEFEQTIITQLSDGGWPVPRIVDARQIDGRLWTVAPFLPGQPKPIRDVQEQRERGILLARLHQATRPLPQRQPWRRCEEILTDHELDLILSNTGDSEAVRIVRWHLDQARRLIEETGPSDAPMLPIHGDFATWNLLFEQDRLTGLIDFELAHVDHRIADFCLSWRGVYDEVVHGYQEVTPLSEHELAFLVPVWWAFLIEGFCQDPLRDEWWITKLMARSELMGSEFDRRPPTRS